MSQHDDRLSAKFAASDIKDMDKRAYFIFGDLFANTLTGVLAAISCAALINTQWPMIIAMLVSMALGMVIALLLGLAVLLRYFGAMEIMVPTMLGGMLSGMFVGMAAAMSPIGPGQAALWGLFIGLASCLFCWLVNARLQGKVSDLPH